MQRWNWGRVLQGIYHAGAIQADKDDNAGYVDINLHPYTQSAEYRRGYQNGYNGSYDSL